MDVQSVQLHRAPLLEGLILDLMFYYFCLEIPNNFRARLSAFSLYPANYVASPDNKHSSASKVPTKKSNQTM